MLPAILALALVSVEEPRPPIRSLDEVRRLVLEGVPAPVLSRRIEESGAAIALSAEEATKLYLEHVPVEVIQAVFATSGSPFPRVAACGSGIEMRYEGYRLLGRSDAMLVSGYSCEGERLALPIEPRTAPVAPAPAAQVKPEKSEEDLAQERARAERARRREAEEKARDEAELLRQDMAEKGGRLSSELIAYGPIPIFWTYPVYPVYPAPAPPDPSASPSPSPTPPGFDRSLSWPHFGSLAWPDLAPPRPPYTPPPAVLAPVPAPRVVRDRINR